MPRRLVLPHEHIRDSDGELSECATGCVGVVPESDIRQSCL